MEENTLVADRKKEWEAKYLAAAEKKARKEHFATLSDIEVRALYSSADVPSGFDERLGFPGEYPFTRGIHPNLFRGKLWTMRQYAGFGSAGQTNERFLYLLKAGQTGLSVAFDLPTQMGFDSDEPISLGEVGRTGVAVDTLDDMRTLFKDIPLDKVSTSMTINAPAIVLLAMYVALAQEQGISREKLQGTVQNDILKEYVARGTYIYPPGPSLRLVTDVIEFCTRVLPSWNPISISGYHMREAGCTAVQEIAFTLLNGMTYVREAIARGLDVDSFAPRLSFFFCAQNNLIEEVAKFRAARRLWASIMKETFGAKNPRSMMLRFHTQTAGCALTAQQPLNNAVRVTLQALAAVLGGTQSLHTNSYDEALALPTTDSVTLALRTQQIIANESGTADTVDPLGGSWYLESLTTRLEEGFHRYKEEIDRRGGMLQAVEDGYVAKEIHNSAYAWQQKVEKKQEIVVGVNEYASGGKTQITRLVIDPTLEEIQRKNLKAVRDSRDASAVGAALDALRRAALGSANLFEPILAAVKAMASIGEVCGVLREVFGEYRRREL
jgi:methylmalonyl-CoA mutase N-terminal domain/subunit